MRPSEGQTMLDGTEKDAIGQTEMVWTCTDERDSQ